MLSKWRQAVDTFKSKHWRIVVLTGIVAIILMCITNIFLNGGTAATYSAIDLSRAAPPPLPADSPAPRVPGGSRGEQKCRRVLEKYFNKPFVSRRPEFLRNPVTGLAMELDCYNAELNLAVEYNGRQHYEYVKFFHSTTDEFVKQQYRDQLKTMLCRQHAITLITVPYTVGLANVEQYLVDQLAAHGFQRASSFV